MVSKGRYFLFIEIIVVFLGNSLVRSVITDVRLVGGPTSNKGTVEIRIDNGTWETTCGNSIKIAIVICRHLGFTGASRAMQNTPYGQNSDPSKSLECDGNEANLAECTLINRCQRWIRDPLVAAVSCHGGSYLGCFVDLSDRVFPGDNVLADPDMTISNCIQYCNESNIANYTYAGVENGNNCFCGEACDDYARHGMGSDANCHVRCSGDRTDSCGAAGYIAVFRIETLSTTLEQEALSPQTSVGQESDFPKEVASTVAMGILFALVTLYGIIITLMYLHLRRSNIALKQSVRDRVGQELNPYTSLDATTMNQPAYEDINTSRQGDRSHTNAIEEVEYGNQRIVEQTARVRKLNM